MSEPWSGEVGAAANEDAPGKAEHCPIESRRDENDDVIAQEVESAVKELIAKEMETMVEEVLDEVLRKTIPTRKCSPISRIKRH